MIAEIDNDNSRRRFIVDVAHETARFGLVLLVLSLILVRLDRGVLALEIAAMLLILGPQVAVLIYSDVKSERHAAMRTLGLVPLLLAVFVLLSSQGWL